MPAHPEMPDVVQCLSLSVGEVEGTGATGTQGQALGWESCLEDVVGGEESVASQTDGLLQLCAGAR